MEKLRRLFVSFLAAVLFVQPALATWSVVVVNTKTGEVAVASATCLANINLIPDLPVVYPGVGAAAVQSARDRNGPRKLVIWNGFAAGQSPAEIFEDLKLINGHQSRQYGIVNLLDAPLTFTGTLAGEGKLGVTGEVGDLKYAIQGNVLVGPEPVLEAEQALLNTPGDVGQKLMAAMEAAAAIGGDGRCSCDVNNPTSCGAPPPGTWKSADTGFMIIGRVGDGLGQCSGMTGCANGKYYLKRNAVGMTTDPDPVILLRQKFDAWRAALSGRPDAILSTVTPGATALPADGLSQTTVVVQLADVDGVALTGGGAVLTLDNMSGLPDVTIPSPVIDHGDGTYEFSLTAGVTPGADLWRITVDDSISLVRLYPYLTMTVDPSGGLHAGLSSISVSKGGFVPLTLNAGPALAGLPYRILATTTGTAPGTTFPFRGATIPLPLNRSRLLWASWNGTRGPWVNSMGTLDANGRATAGFQIAPGAFSAYVGGHIDLASIVWQPTAVSVSIPTGFDVLP